MARCARLFARIAQLSEWQARAAAHQPVARLPVSRRRWKAGYHPGVRCPPWHRPFTVGLRVIASPHCASGGVVLFPTPS
jgi:hypothetical protein